MADLKLAKLPDRTPVKLTITLGAELNMSLKDYAELYEATYGITEQVTDLIPFMLEAFLSNDKAFVRVSKR
ncbi:MAG: transposase [Asticcacaulis sp. 32-58-5]|nr:MAG: transposase [Asticcacaulis sp. 32-58-5]